MRHISLAAATPGMILARSTLNRKGQILLVAGVTLTEEYIRKLQGLNLDTLFIKDATYADINVPEYLSMETQQRALSILTTTMERVHKEGNFALDPLSRIASDIVEELVTQPDVTIHLTGIATYDD
ncbi:MAG: HD-GYP domain-containing protein, partial [Sporomusaceae bacterium]|nr:HD-GYP domain-containing protein [Sporomusaceae bacterium]